MHMLAPGAIGASTCMCCGMLAPHASTGKYALTVARKQAPQSARAKTRTGLREATKHVPAGRRQVHQEAICAPSAADPIPETASSGLKRCLIQYA